jgi:hypothetical protein
MIRTLTDRPEGFTDGSRLIAGRPYPAIQKRPPYQLPGDRAGPPFPFSPPP